MGCVGQHWAGCRQPWILERADHAIHRATCIHSQQAASVLPRWDHRRVPGQSAVVRVVQLGGWT